MSFRDVEIQGFDKNDIKRYAGSDYVEVPFILSYEPPEAWKESFLDEGPYFGDAFYEVEIVGDRVIFLCKRDWQAISKDGECWNTVAKYIELANQNCRKKADQLQRERDREEEARLQEEERQKEFDKWKRSGPDFRP